MNEQKMKEMTEKLAQLPESVQDKLLTLAEGAAYAVESMNERKPA